MLTMEEKRKEWISALRSGRFAQTTKKLQSSEGYCCLGVACKVYSKLTKSKIEISSHGELSKDTGLDKVRRYFGLAGPQGQFHVRIRGFSSLAALNDDGNMDFNSIADIIEANPQGLFTEEK